MRAGDLLGAPVLDPEGRRVGQVVDIRVLPSEDGRRLTVDGLLLSRHATRLFGYERGAERGPAVFERLAARIHRHDRYAHLSEVAFDDGVRLRVDWDDLPELGSV